MTGTFLLVEPVRQALKKEKPYFYSQTLVTVHNLIPS